MRDPTCTEILQLFGVPERIQQRVIPDTVTGCWLWTGGKTGVGYAEARWNGRTVGNLHRPIYQAIKGTIPDDAVLDHLCRVRHCLNPDHLEVTTHRVNILRGTGGSARNATKTHCPNGHPYDIQQGGVRGCRQCRNAYYMERYYRTRILKGYSSGDRWHSQRVPVTHCKRGHEFTPENTRVWGGTHRACITCGRAASRAGSKRD